MLRTLAVDGRLQVGTPAGPAQLSGRGSLISITVANAAVFLGLRHHGLARRSRRTRRLEQWDRALRTAGLMVAFNIRGRTVATIGSGSHAGIISRLVGWHPLQIRLRSVLASAFDRKR